MLAIKASHLASLSGKGYKFEPFYSTPIYIYRAKVDWDFQISDRSKTLMEPIFNTCGEFLWSPEGPVSQIHSPHLHVGAPGIFSDLLRSVQMLKREWGAESNGKLLHLSIPCKTAAWVPEFAVEDLPLSRTATLVPEFAVKDVPWGRILMMMMMMIYIGCGCKGPHIHSHGTRMR